MIVRWLSLVYEVDAVVASRWWSEKLKAAIHERVLAHSLCDAVISTGPCGTPFRRRADSILAQFLRLSSLSGVDLT
jgi:hypothetical protein